MPLMGSFMRKRDVTLQKVQLLESFLRTHLILLDKHAHTYKIHYIRELNFPKKLLSKIKRDATTFPPIKIVYKLYN